MSEIVSDALASAGAEAQETFCSYLVKQLIAKQGYTTGTVPEAERLNAACDIVLTQRDGYPFTILCVIDRERNPHARFDLDMTELERIAGDCAKYSARNGFVRMPVIIRVIELGPGTPEQRQRLAVYNAATFLGYRITAFAVDTTGRTVWSSSRWFNAPEKSFIEGLLRHPRESDDEIVASAATQAPARVTPYVSFGILAALVLIFAAEIVFGVTPWKMLLEVSPATLAGFGGLQYPLVVDRGEWWRVFSAPLLHVNAVHLLFNGVALVVAGYSLERFVGRSWFAAIFVIGALGGACGSLLTLPAGIVSAGASGAIMGLFAAILVVSFRYGSSIRTQLQMNAIQVLVPSLLPVMTAGSITTVDYGAHAGGAVAGALAAFILGRLWPNQDLAPPLRSAALAIVAAGAIGVAAVCVAFPASYRFYSAFAQLIPANEVPSTDAEIMQRAAVLLERYPRDPRSYYYQAFVQLKNNDLAGAERHLRTGLGEKYVLEKLMLPAFHLHMQGLMALVLYDLNRIDDGRVFAKPGCDDRKSPLFDKLLAAGLCAAAAR